MPGERRSERGAELLQRRALLHLLELTENEGQPGSAGRSAGAFPHVAQPAEPEHLDMCAATPALSSLPPLSLPDALPVASMICLRMSGHQRSLVCKIDMGEAVPLTGQNALTLTER